MRPCEMIFLLARGRREALADRWITRGQRLRAVERLRANFASVIDAHQARGMTLLSVVERRLRKITRGVGPLGSYGASQRTQRAIEANDEVVCGQGFTR